MSAAALPFRHLLLALLIVTIWGSNFVAVKLALTELPPLLLCTVRFVFVAIPAVFFLPRPAVPIRLLVLYGFTMFGFQFGFLFVGMKLGLSAGLASLVLQFQVFVTLGLASVLLKERITLAQVGGALIAGAGFVLVGVHTGGEITFAGLGCVLLAAVSWAFGNLTSKRIGRVHPLALVAWGSLVVPVPMAIASLTLEGPTVVWHSLTHLGWTGILSAGYIVYFSTVIAYSLWSFLLVRHPATAVTPFALLVPVVGMLTSALLLHEPLPAWKLEAATLVIAGLALNVFGPKPKPGRDL